MQLDITIKKYLLILKIIVMKTKHTKGIWSVLEGKNKEFYVFVNNDNALDFIYHRVASIFATSLKEREANAKLISAAPELLNSLTELLNLLEENEPQWYLRGHYNRAIKAIKKATE